MLMGVSYNDFWKMNPRILKAFAKAYELKNKEIDRTAWLYGRYVFEATVSAVAMNLHGRKAKQRYRDKPYSAEAIEQKTVVAAKHLTEEDKRSQTEQLFTKLRIMQSNFNRTHGGEA